MKISFYILLLVCLVGNLHSQTLSTSYSDNNDSSTLNRSVILGVEAGGNDTDNGVFVGYRAGHNSLGATNTALGYFAGAESNSSRSVYIGQSAGYESVNASLNLAIGPRAGAYMTGGSNNLMIGSDAGIENSGSYNVFLGGETGEKNTGNYNIFVGRNSGNENVGGSNNIYLGANSAQENFNGSGNVFIGHEAGKFINSTSNTLVIENSSNPIPLIYGDFSSDKVGINTTNLTNTVGGQNISNYSLYVEGGLLSDEVRVRTTWADYVFNKEYQLKSISELETFIDQFGHLPNCPPEKQVREQGIEIGDITRIQQEKIEELTLYIIEQNKSIETLRDELNNLNLMFQKVLGDIN